MNHTSGLTIRARRLRRGLAIAMLCGGLTVGGCAISPQQEAQIGADYSAQINRELPIINDASLNNYINQVGSQIASRGQRGIPYRFYIVNSNVVNAFAVPGGYVYLNRGLIERFSNASELAGVLAHEISHVELRHSVEQMEKMQQANLGVGVLGILLGQNAQGAAGQIAGAAVNVGGNLYFAGHSRAAESEADANAVPLMVASGYNPNGLTTMFRKLLSEEKSRPAGVAQWFSTHPLTQERINSTQATIDRVPASQKRSLTTDTNAFQSFKSRLRNYSPRPKD